MRNLKNLLLILLVSSISGCATTQVAIKKNITFNKYKRIYLSNIKDDPRKVIPRVEQHLKKMGFDITMVDANEPPGGTQGSGFIVSEDGYLVTAAHVLNKKDKATVWVSGVRYEADLIYKEEEPEEKENGKDISGKNMKERMESALNSKDNQSIYEEINKKDLAILKIKTLDSNIKFTPLIFAKNPSYKMGEEIYIIGFPLSYILGDTPRLNKGLISSTVGPKDNPDYLQISAEVQPGNSGGPLLNAGGQVVGMVQMTLNPINILVNSGGSLPQNVNFAMKNNKIKDFIKNCKDKAKINLREDGSMDLDKAKDSIAQIRSGIIATDFKNQPKLACSVVYQSFWDMWYRFVYLDIIFYDLDTQEVVLKAGQYGDNPFSNIDSTLSEVFRDIEAKLK